MRGRAHLGVIYLSGCNKVSRQMVEFWYPIAIKIILIFATDAGLRKERKVLLWFPFISILEFGININNHRCSNNNITYQNLYIFHFGSKLPKFTTLTLFSYNIRQHTVWSPILIPNLSSIAVCTIQ